MKAAEVKITYQTKVKPSERSSISRSYDAQEIFRQFYSEDDIERVEIFSVMLLNRANKVLGVNIVSTGTATGCMIDPKQIFQASILANASAIILCHNHPSGNMKASEQDIALTKKIKAGCELLDIQLLDHIILSPSNNEYLSLSESGLF